MKNEVFCSVLLLTVILQASPSMPVGSPQLRMSQICRAKRAFVVLHLYKASSDETKATYTKTQGLPT